MSNIPACQFGFLILHDVDWEDNFLLIKANKIMAIRASVDEDDKPYSNVYMNYDEIFSVKETTAEILKKLESIHPSLR